MAPSRGLLLHLAVTQAQLYLEDGLVRGVTATFSPPVYGVRLRGPLLHVNDACALTGATAAPVPGSLHGGIAVARRGGCSFLAKAKQAAAAGALAVVVTDPGSELSEEDLQYVTLSYDFDEQLPGSGLAVSPTPLLLIAAAASQRLMESTTSTAGSSYAELSWDTADTVEVDVWGANVFAVAHLLAGFAPTARELQGRVRLLVHYRLETRDLEDPDVATHCFEAYPGLCAPPVGGFSGAEVLDEVLSQLCIWHYTRNNATGAEYSAAWWSYIEALAGCLQDRADGTHEEYQACVAGARAQAANATCSDDAYQMLETERLASAWTLGEDPALSMRINGWRYSGAPSAEALAQAVCGSFSTSACTKCWALPPAAAVVAVTSALLAIGVTGFLRRRDRRRSEKMFTAFSGRSPDRRAAARCGAQPLSQAGAE